MAKPGKELRKMDDYEIKASNKIIALADWMWALGWFLLVVGIIGAIASGGSNDEMVGAFVLIGLSSVLASRLVRGFGLLVEQTILAHRSNLQIVSLLEHLHERLDRQEQTEQQQVWAEDDFAKYSEE